MPGKRGVEGKRAEEKVKRETRSRVKKAIVAQMGLHIRVYCSSVVDVEVSVLHCLELLLERITRKSTTGENSVSSSSGITTLSSYGFFLSHREVGIFQVFP